jgi:hypothetical protein
MLFPNLNIYFFLHQNIEEGTLHFDSNTEFILMIWGLNQGNPSINIAMDASEQGRICISFFMPFATVCNQNIWHGNKQFFICFMTTSPN